MDLCGVDVYAANDSAVRSVEDEGAIDSIKLAKW